MNLLETTPIPDEETMRAAGFTDHREGFWYYTKSFGHTISFDVSIDKETGAWTEHVLDNDFGQPYHYGVYATDLAQSIRQKVDDEVEHLRSIGIAIRVDHREYGCSDNQPTEEKANQ